MPLVFSDHSFGSGDPYLSVRASGRVELADVEALVAQLERPEYRLGKVLCVTAKGTDSQPEVRRAFRKTTDMYGSMANVVTSPIVRATTNLMVRLMPQGDKFKMFPNEAEALAWLERRPHHFDWMKAHDDAI